MLAFFAKIGSFLTGLLGFQVFQATNKFALLGILISMFLALYAAFILTVTGVFSFSPVKPSGNVAAGLALLPGNIFQCMSAIGSAHLAAHVFLVKSKILKIASKGA
ncbi:TPA: DUF5455 family protein [Vibrio alginolyticus]